MRPDPLPETSSDRLSDPPTLGADLRALRRSRGMTLQALADAVDRSVGWLSQVERDLSQPAPADLTLLAEVLDVSVTSLLCARAPLPEVGLIVRAGARRPIGGRVPGLNEELLSPDLTDDFEMVRSVFQPGARLPDPVARPTQEVGYVVSGRMTLWIDETRFHLTPGDSFRIRGEPFRWENPHDDPCVVIWVIAPPVY